MTPLRITFENLSYSVPVKNNKKRRNPFRRRARSNREAEGPQDVEEAESTGAQGAGGLIALGASMAEPQEAPPDRVEIETEHANRHLILKNLSGIFREGRLTAIIGSSGAGKTTLLSLLAGDVIRGSRISGNVYLNDEEVSGNWKKMREVSAFVFQDDLLLSTMTVREAIWQSLLLRTPAEMNKEQQKQRLEETLRIFRLQQAKDTVVGNPDKKGISGGERKRTAIAMDVCIRPSVLFLDEPTSGLDTYTAFTVVKILKNLTTLGHTIVMTIHQPSSEIFGLCDDLMVMARGEILYLGEAQASVPYFSGLGYPCPQCSNPADYFFMSVIQGVDMASEEENQQGGEVAEVKLQRLLQAWRQSPQNASITALCNQRPNITISGYLHRAPFLRQFWYLLGRASRNAIRNPLVIRVRIFQTVFVAVFIGLSFINLNRLSPTEQIQNKFGVIFFMALNQFFSSATGVMTIFAVEKFVFFREYRAGYYGLPAYYLSKVLVELPYQIVFPALFVLIIYYMVGLNPPFSRYLLAACLVILAGICGAVKKCPF